MKTRGLLGAAVGLALLACSGATKSPAPPLPPPAPAPTPANPAKKIVGSWRLIPDEAKLRELKIIAAALSGQPQKVERLGDLTPDEQKLFDEWKHKSGPEVREKKNDLRLLRGYSFEITDAQISVRFGEDETYGPVDYTVTSASDDAITLQFDPKLGYGLETHSIQWQGPDRGVDTISAAGRNFDPMTLVRKQ